MSVTTENALLREKAARLKVALQEQDVFVKALCENLGQCERKIEEQETQIRILQHEHAEMKKLLYEALRIVARYEPELIAEAINTPGKSDA